MGMQNARVAKWQTHYLEVVAPKGVEVRILSRAPENCLSHFQKNLTALRGAKRKVGWG